MELLHKETTDKILKGFYNVYNKMGYGFSEKVYENSLLIELRKFGLRCEKQKQISVYYDDEKVGDYYADIVVEGLIILELKAASGIASEHEVQLYNYLRATDIELGYVLNFGEKPQFKRILFTNDRKHIRNVSTIQALP
jgi:GxxExxY protein